jgi:hypothetical protein
LVLSQSRFDPRNEVTAIGLIIGMLKLTATALRKMTAWRHLMVLSRRQRAVIEDRVTRNTERHVTAIDGHTVASGSDSDDQLVHKVAIAS